MMTVKQLKEELNNYDDDLEVVIDTPAYYLSIEELGDTNLYLSSLVIIFTSIPEEL